MIAKRVHKVKGASNFARLARYVVDARGGVDPATWKRTADYILDTSHGGEKVGGVRVSNCYSEDPAMAAVEIAAKQALNRRSKSDRTYHLVVSFPPGERPTLAQLHYIEDELCAAIGFADHQRISAVHTDTKHLHLHVAVSKVHPETLRCIEPYYDKQSLMQACERLEVELGLQRTNHGRLWAGRKNALGGEHGLDGTVADQGPGRRVSGRAGDMEAHAARQSFLGWVRERMRASLDTLSGWPEFHRRLAEYGLHARLRGAGLVIGAGEGGGLYVQASKVDRSLSLHALTRRWGEFVVAGPECHEVPVRERYDAQPTQRHPQTGGLFVRYQRARQDSLTKRAEARERLREAHARYATQLIEWYDTERRRLKDDKRLRGKAKLEALKQLSAKKRTDLRERRQLESEQRREVTATNPLLTWPQFLVDLARAGDERALAVIRHRARRSRAGETGDSFSAAEAGADTTHVSFPTPDAQVDKNGDVIYRLRDGGVVIDGPASVRVLQGSEGAMALALALAQERFTNRRLVIDGTETFGATAAHTAGEQGLNVCFADERLERLRQAAGSVSGKARGQADIESYIVARNKLHEQLTDIPEHRRWTAADVGTVLYGGRRRFQDGTEAVLLRREGLMLVMPVSDAQAAKAAGWKLGTSINVDSRGRFVSGLRSSRRS